MEALTVKFPKSIRVNSGASLEIDLNDPLSNSISINQIDYIPYYLNNDNPGNKGGNSFVIKLVKAEDFEDDYPEIPDLVLKISRFNKRKYSSPKDRSTLFESEIEILLNCKKEGVPNTMPILHHGTVESFNSKDACLKYPFYAMPFAIYDLPNYLCSRNLSFSSRLDLCIELCFSLKQLWSLNYIHRDIKPDNILFTNENWVLSDLGLAKHRDVFEELKKNEWVGPRGWMSPEAMNRFLCTEMPWSHLYDNVIDHQSDIYQLGKVFWYILQGNSPEGGFRRDAFKWQQEEVYQIVRTMLNHSKRSRYSTIDAVISELKKVHARVLKKGEPAPLYA